MHYKIVLSFCIVTIAMMGFVLPSYAVSLGKVDVASHLGEQFYAEVPLTLDDGEDVTALAVELASPSDYRILEVYRADALRQIKTEIESDSRGVRVKLSSRSVINAPFVNIVLKVRYGLATHYKKYPVFLDLPRTASAPASGKIKKPVVQTQAIEPSLTGESEVANADPLVQAVIPNVESTSAVEDEAKSSFSPYDKWARTAKYGPMVYGDTVTVVAQRLRVDDRYTNEQVMVALFEKNRGQFVKGNINLIKAGTYLDVPTAEEVERVRPDQARSILSGHAKRWREEPRYAAVAEAQRTRYSNRIRMGQSASGVASKPVMESSERSSNAVKPDSSSALNETSASPQEKASASSVDHEKMSVISSENTTLKNELAALQEQNSSLQKRLALNEEKLTQLAAAGAVQAPSAEVESVASMRIKKLELQLARLQSELDKAKENVVETVDSGMDWLIYLLGALVVLLLGGVAFLLSRKSREQPAMDMNSESMIDDDIPAFVEHEVDASLEITGEQEPSLPEVEIEDTDFTASIPDLTDEDTSQFEAMQEDTEEDADPNVDYLSEADVYMRYGMEDEAEKQVLMALKLREDHRDAHVKLVQIRNARGDSEGVNNAINAAKAILMGAALSQFEEAVSASADSSKTEDNSLEDTIPPGDLNVSEVSSEPAMIESGEQDSDDLDLSGLDFDMGDVTEPSDDLTAKGPEEDVETADDLEIGDLDFDMGEITDTPKTTAPSVDSAAAIESADDLDLGGLDFASLEDDVTEVSNEKPAETAPVASDDLDFDLSGLNMPDLDTGDSADESSGGFDLSDLDVPDSGVVSLEDDASVLTSDLDKTVVMDWDKDTIVGLEDVGGEDVSDVLQTGSEVSPATEGDILDLDLGDLGDLNEPVDIGQVSDDFTGTIQSNVEDILAQPLDDTESNDAADAFGLDSLEIDLEASVDEEVGILETSLRDMQVANTDLDATMQLDSLLDELGSLVDEDDLPKNKGKDES